MLNFLCYDLIEAWRIHQFALHGKRLFSKKSNLETAINNVKQTVSASRKFVGFGYETVTVMMQVGYCSISAQ